MITRQNKYTVVVVDDSPAILKAFAATQSGVFTHKASTLKNYLIDNIVVIFKGEAV